jgi:3-phenylpropionate/trans-cinnamate dioxygenase ferredoxin reductase subunit
VSAAAGDNFVILGAGQAGGRAAEAARSAGYKGRLAIIGDETMLPYERPPLSKDLLAGRSSCDALLVRDTDWFDKERVALHLGQPAVEIDRKAAQVILADGTRVPYSSLLLATGARPRQLPFAPPAERIHYLRTAEDCFRLREALTLHGHLAIIGAGFIGLEVAATARALGCTVTVLELAPAPLMRAVMPEIGGFFTGLHRGHGVELRYGVRVQDIDAGEEAVHIQTAEGGLTAHHVLVGIGVVPNDELAQSAGLDVDDGVLVDACARTNDPAIFAAGDVARRESPRYGRHIRFESWHNAQNHAIAAARNMLGQPVPYDEVPWFWSDQYDVNFQSAGATQAEGETVRRPGAADNSFALFLLEGGRLAGVQAINFQRDMRWARRLIELGAEIAPERLADPAVKLQELVPKAG